MPAFNLVSNGPSFESVKLKRLFFELPNNLQKKILAADPSQPGIYLLACQILNKNLVLKYEFDRNRTITHIGFNIFDIEAPESKQIVQKYIERILLTLAVAPDQLKMVKIINEENLLIFINHFQISEKSHSSINRIFDITPGTSCRIHSSSDFYSVIFELRDSTQIELWFPKDYAIISGKEKDEIERQFVEELVVHKSPRLKHAQPDPAKMRSVNSFFLLSGSVYLDQKNINSDIWYLKKAAGGFYPVFAETAYQESFSNLLLNSFLADKTIKVNIHLYGNKTMTHTLMLNNLLDYFEKEALLYFGWQSSDPVNLIATLFIQNKAFNYIHLMTVESSVKSLFSTKEPIQGDLFLFIPRYNLSKLNISQ